MKKKIIKNCIICNAKFETKIERFVTCSKRCAFNNHRKQRGITNKNSKLKTKTEGNNKRCIVCYSKFVSTSKISSCCSLDCIKIKLTNKKNQLIKK